MKKLIEILFHWLVWFIIRSKNCPDVPQIVYKHSCGSESVIPLGKLLAGWKEPAFECLGCGRLTNQGITARLVDPQDKMIQTRIKSGLTVLHPQH